MEKASPQNQNPRKPSFLGALEFGFLEIAFVTIVLVLFFGTLNYFNILSLSKTFPQYFSWLPTQPTPVATIKQPLVTKPTPVPKITEKQAEKDLGKIINTYVNPDYSTPDNKTITKAAEGNIQGVNETTYVSSWKTNDGVTIQAFTGYQNGILQTSYQKFFLGIPEKLISNLNATNAATIASKYFTFNGSTKCFSGNATKKPTPTICQITKENKNGTLAIQINYPYEGK